MPTSGSAAYPCNTALNEGNLAAVLLYMNQNKGNHFVLADLERVERKVVDRPPAYEDSGKGQSYDRKHRY